MFHDISLTAFTIGMIGKRIDKFSEKYMCTFLVNITQNIRTLVRIFKKVSNKRPSKIKAYMQDINNLF